MGKPGHSRPVLPLPPGWRAKAKAPKRLDDKVKLGGKFSAGRQ